MARGVHRGWLVAALSLTIIASVVAACGGSGGPGNSTAASPTLPSATAGLEGKRFSGNGYSIVIPSQWPLGYNRAAGGDVWAANGPNGLPITIGVLQVTNLLPNEQSLEGVVGRIENGLANANAVVSDKTTVGLSGGGSYRLSGTMAGAPMITYAMYRQGVGYQFLFSNFPSDVGRVLRPLEK